MYPHDRRKPIPTAVLSPPHTYAVTPIPTQKSTTYLNKIYLFYIMYMSILHACVYVQYMAWYLQRSDEGIRSSGARNGCKTPCECWELKEGPQQKSKCL